MEIACGPGVDLRQNHPSFTTVGRAYLLFPGDDKYEWFHKLLKGIPNGLEYLSTLKIYARLHPKALYLRYLSDTETDNRPSSSGERIDLGIRAQRPYLSKDPIDETEDAPDVDYSVTHITDYDRKQITTINDAIWAMWHEPNYQQLTINRILNGTREMARANTGHVCSDIQFHLIALTKMLTAVAQSKLLVMGNPAFIDAAMNNEERHCVGQVYCRMRSQLDHLASYGHYHDCHVPPWP